MKFLFVMDPLRKLDRRWDTSLCLMRELARRGHECWSADIENLAASGRAVTAQACRLQPRNETEFSCSPPAARDLERFDAVLIRKDPPFDANYLAMTYMLESIAGRVPVVNDPQGIRSTNEKFPYPELTPWMPPTLVTASLHELAAFLKKHGKIVLKPLYEKGGFGVRLVAGAPQTAVKTLVHAVRGGRVVVAQKHISTGPEKRILILDGKFLAAYEKRAARGDFRANLGLGGTFHPAKLNSAETKLVRSVSAYLRKQKLQFAGLDVRAEKLIDLNVTSPAGITEARILYPRLGPEQSWADSLEALAGR